MDASELNFVRFRSIVNPSGGSRGMDRTPCPPAARGRVRGVGKLRSPISGTADTWRVIARTSGMREKARVLYRSATRGLPQPQRRVAYIERRPARRRGLRCFPPFSSVNFRRRGSPSPPPAGHHHSSRPSGREEFAR